MSSKKYAYMSWAETAALTFTILKLPIYLTFTVAKFLIFKGQFKGITRYTTFAALRYLTRSTMPQVQWLAGTTRGVYSAWAKQSNLPLTEEHLVDDAKIYWIGQKRNDKVVLYVHGGGFFAPLQECSLHFWNHIRLELEKQGVEAGFAVLGYGLLPEAQFPTQLRQLAVAVDHLLATGLHPSNLHLVGDSAGGNLILQFLSQLLHPLDRIGPVQDIVTPIGGAYLMSPLVALEYNTKSFFNAEDNDIFDASTVTQWSKAYLDGVPDSKRPYAAPATAGPTWFNGLETKVKRILVSAGGEERFLDDITAFVDTLQKSSNVDIQYEIQPGAVHDDPFYDFFLTKSPSQLGILNPVIVKWLKLSM